VTVYIGRFNPFHLGHAHVLRNALETSKLTIVLIGSSGQSRSLKNPFTFKERKSMIQHWFTAQDLSHTELQILPLRDHPYNDTDWIAEVQSKVKVAVTEFCVAHSTILTDVHITGSDRDDSTWYLHAFPQWKPALVGEHRLDGGGQLSATAVRTVLFDIDVPEPSQHDLTKLLGMLPFTTYEFLEQFSRSPEHALLAQEYAANKAYKKAWSVAPYAPIFSTIDAVVIQSGHVLVVERGAFPGKGLWALPGGFLNQNERLLDGAIRELLEETGLRLADGKRAKELTEIMLKGYMRSKEIFDKPDRSSRGRTITVGYLFRLDDTKPLPKVKGQNMPLHESGGIEIVETAKAMWIPISRALSESSRWFEDHHALIEWAASIPDHR
jgi:bifunctional NMN adenylyltransferase/nudix hydrolase